MILLEDFLRSCEAAFDACANKCDYDAMQAIDMIRNNVLKNYVK
jgi:hypothetical protein